MQKKRNPTGFRRGDLSAIQRHLLNTTQAATSAYNHCKKVMTKPTDKNTFEKVEDAAYVARQNAKAAVDLINETYVEYED